MNSTTTPHNFNHPFELTNVIDMDVAKVYFYGSIAVIEVVEGKNYAFTTANNLFIKSLKILGKRKWVYVSNRKNMYTINPNDYVYLRKLPNMIGMAIVCKTEEDCENAAIEERLVKKDFLLTRNLEEAMLWAKELLKRNAI